MLPLLAQEKKVCGGASLEIIASPRDAVDHNTLRATKPFGQVLARVRASEIESGSARASGRKVFGVAGSRRIILPGGSGPATRYAVRRHLSLEAQSRRVGTRQERTVLGRWFIRKMLCRGTVLVLAALACHRGVLADVPVSPGALQCLSVAINRCSTSERSRPAGIRWLQQSR